MVVLHIFFYFHPDPWGNDPIWAVAPPTKIKCKLFIQNGPKWRSTGVLQDLGEKMGFCSTFFLGLFMEQIVKSSKSPPYKKLWETLQALTVYQEASQQQLLHVPLQLHISAGKIRYRKVGAKKCSILDHALLAV